MFEICHYNFRMVSQGDWIKTTYKIYNNKKIDIVNEYINKESIDKTVEINLEDYNKLKTLIDRAILVNEKVVAYDGDTWSFIYYKNDKIYWQRETDYIYGIKELEDIANILIKYNKE